MRFYPKPAGKHSSAQNLHKGGEIARVGMLILIVMLLVTVSCEEKNTMEPGTSIDPEVERVVGFYKATTFTEPGSFDGGIDILAGGGVLVAQLFSSGEVLGYYFMPDTIDTNFPPRDFIYRATFELNEDTLTFRRIKDVVLDTLETGVALDFYPFIAHDDHLETADLGGRLGTFKIILERR